MEWTRSFLLRPSAVDVFSAFTMVLGSAVKSAVNEFACLLSLLLRLDADYCRRDTLQDSAMPFVLLMPRFYNVDAAAQRFGLRFCGTTNATRPSPNTSRVGFGVHV